MSEDYLSRMLEQARGRTAALLGLREFPQKSNDEQRSIMGSEMRLQALQQMTTTTLPYGLQAELKRNIALNVSQQQMISDVALKDFPCIYIGSGGDIEYPLALGARRIVMVDPACGLPRYKELLIRSIEMLIGEQVSSSDPSITFGFDFGAGKEQVSVELFAGKYARGASGEDPDMPRYALPEKVGSILMFATQDRYGLLEVDEEMRRSIVPGGAILRQFELIVKDKEGKEHESMLGAEPK